ADQGDGVRDGRPERRDDREVARDHADALPEPGVVVVFRRVGDGDQPQERLPHRGMLRAPCEIAARARSTVATLANVHAAPRRTSLRRRPRAGLAVLASLALIAGSMLVWLPLASAITFDPCLLSPELCATLTIQPIGDGYGFVESTKTNGGN